MLQTAEILCLLASAAILFAPAPAAADAAPQAVGVLSDYGQLMPRRDVADGIIPNGRVARNAGLAAWYADATGRYPHGVLGDRLEAGALVVERDGVRYRYELDERAVFEDLEPRIVDANGDGQPEILAIKSTLDRGSAVALYGLQDGALVLLAESPSIGTPNRWLNPAGVADYDGDGQIEIAAVLTPHIGGVLVHYAWGGGPELRIKRQVRGYSTHRIGSTVLDLAYTVDWNGDGVPDLILPRQNRSVLVVLTVEDGGFRELAAFRHPAEIVTRLDGDAKPGHLLYGDADGTVWALPLPE